ncbi:MAG: pinensin family lanthipeptide [Cyclobacteriaceae bacterium]
MKKKLKLDDLKLKSFVTTEKNGIKGGAKGPAFDIGTNPIDVATQDRGCIEPVSEGCWTNPGYIGNPMCQDWTMGDQPDCVNRFTAYCG